MLAPTKNEGGTLNAPATVLAESIKANNTFSTGDNCVVAEFYGAVLALDLRLNNRREKNNEKTEARL